MTLPDSNMRKDGMGTAKEPTRGPSKHLETNNVNLEAPSRCGDEHIQEANVAHIDSVSVHDRREVQRGDYLFAQG